MNNKNLRPSLLDQHQMTNLMFDPEHDAQRVIIVGNYSGQPQEKIQAVPTVETAQLAPVVQKEYITVPQIERIEVPHIIKEVEIREIQVPVIQQEIKIVEVEKIVFVPQIKIVEIEKPTIVKEIEYKQIEKPIIIEKASGHFNKVIIGMIVAHCATIIHEIVTHFFK